MTHQTPVIEIGRIEHGWADVTIRLGYRLSNVTVSNLTGGLGEFVTMVEQAVGRTLSGVECRWEHEQSGISAVTMRRCGAGEHEFELRVGAHDGHNLSTESVPDFTTEISGVVDVRDMARATLAAFAQLREDYGVEGYAELWRRPFPQDRLDAIVAHLREGEQIEAEARRVAEMPNVLPEVLCHGRTTSAEIAAAMGISHDRVVEALRWQADRNRFQLKERADGVSVVPGSLNPDLQRQLPLICRDIWAKTSVDSSQ